MNKSMHVTAAKASGMKKSVAARGKGLLGVFQLLARQHGEVAALLDRASKDPTQHDELWPEIRLALLSHERGELEAVYPALDRYEALQPLVQQHAEEADELEDTIDRLDTMSPDSDEWGSVFETLCDLVRAHVTEEEDEIFPIALNEIGSGPAKEIEHDYKIAQKHVQTSLKKMVH